MINQKSEELEMNAPDHRPEKDVSPERADALRRLFQALNPLEKAVVQLKFGLDGESRTLDQVAQMLEILPEAVRHYELSALEKLRDPSWILSVQDDWDLVFGDFFGEPATLSSEIQVAKPIEQIASLTPDIMDRLKKSGDDFRKLRFDIFEHFVAELLASIGFDEVKLVGQCPDTSADIFALKKLPEIGDELRYFVEVKRWKDKVGVQVVDAVYGAMLLERPNHAWRAAMVVSAHEFTEFKKYRGTHLRNMGVLLKDRSDLLEWLSEYKPNSEGLWVPADHATCELGAVSRFGISRKTLANSRVRPSVQFINRSKKENAEQYTEDIHKIHELTDEVKQELRMQLAGGDRDSKIKLVRHHLPLVVTLAQRAKQINCETEMLAAIQEGNLALIRAVESDSFFQANDIRGYITEFVWARFISLGYVSSGDASSP